jgi:hypothetical protein
MSPLTPMCGLGAEEEDKAGSTEPIYKKRRLDEAGLNCEALCPLEQTLANVLRH